MILEQDIELILKKFIESPEEAELLGRKIVEENKKILAERIRIDLEARLVEIKAEEIKTQKLPCHYDMMGHQPGCGVCGHLRSLSAERSKIEFKLKYPNGLKIEHTIYG